MKLDVLGDRPQHTLPPSLGQNRRSNLLGIDKQANKWPAATCGEYKGAVPRYILPLLAAGPESRPE